MTSATIRHLLEQINIPDNDTISRTIYQDEQIKAVLFGFAAGQELSEHTAATPATMHFVQGEAQVTIGQEVPEAKPNTLVHMPTHLPHSMLACTLAVMLLLFVRGAQ